MNMALEEKCYMSENGSIGITDLTALYAALVSTAIDNDRGRLKVSVGFRSLINGGRIEDNLLVWHITNVGRRSVLVTHVAGECEPAPGGEFTNFLVNDIEMPKRLTR
jgi:hypothetical protein